jgi:putative heme-binding domain-containing protein
MAANYRRSIERVSRTLLWLVVLALGALPGRATVEAQMHAGQYEQADIEYGASLFASRCVACHGERGDLIPTANLRSGRFRNASSDRELNGVIRNGIPGTAMVATGYSESELAALVAYLRNMTTVDLRGALQGDVERGRALYFGTGDCGSCQRVAGTGPRSAPDLSNIGAVRTAATLQRTLLDANEGLLPINRPVRAVLRDGTVVNGRRLNEDTFSVQLIDERERLVSLKKAELREYTVSTAAAMPSYKDVFSEQERADVVMYLLSLKGVR